MEAVCCRDFFRGSWKGVKGTLHKRPLTIFVQSSRRVVGATSQRLEQENSSLHWANRCGSMSNKIH
eukprot:2581226-Ditylum_brightwellii.AAC.2